MADWTDRERSRYDRHFRLADFGEAGQCRLKNSQVLVVGAGGLGSPVLQYLAAAGVGGIGIVEDDRIDASNLQRQTIFTEAQTGQSKARRAAAFVTALNSDVEVLTWETRLTRTNAEEILHPFDLVLDCSDNFPTRYLVNDACVLFDKPLVHGAVHRWEGQAAVFNVLLADGERSPNYRDLFPLPPAPGVVDDCATAGVLGVLPGIIGCLMANEALKLLAGAEEVQHSKLLLFDAAAVALRRLKIRKRPDVVIKELIDYAAFCGTEPVAQISAEEAETVANVYWLDVRSAAEHAAGAISSARISLEELPARRTELPATGTVIAYCRSGARSAQVVRWLQAYQPDLRSYSLKGGYPAYVDQKRK